MFPSRVSHLSILSSQFSRFLSPHPALLYFITVYVNIVYHLLLQGCQLKYQVGHWAYANDLPQWRQACLFNSCRLYWYMCVCCRMRHRGHLKTGAIYPTPRVVTSTARLKNYYMEITTNFQVFTLIIFILQSSVLWHPVTFEIQRGGNMILRQVGCPPTSLRCVTTHKTTMWIQASGLLV